MFSTGTFDKYVCFRDDNEPSFAVVSTIEDAMDAARRNGDKAGEMAVAKLADTLFVQTYFKGVASDQGVFYDKIEDGRYSLDFDSPARQHRQMAYFINWKTGRYRFLIYAMEYSKDSPLFEVSGKCELIHPRDKASVVAAR